MVLARSRFSVAGVFLNSLYRSVCEVLLMGGLVEAAGDAGRGGEVGIGVPITLMGVAVAAAAAAAVFPRVRTPSVTLDEVPAAGTAGVGAETTR